MEKNNKLIKNIIFSIVPLIVLFVILEIIFRCIFFQMKGDDLFAVISAVSSAKRKILEWKTSKHIQRIGIYDRAEDVLFTDKGASLLNEFKDHYEEEFKNLVSESKKIDSKLIMVYIPSDDYHKEQDKRDICRSFYRILAAKHNIDYIDLTAEFMKYPVSEVTLLPQNGHLSRFGNKIVARRIAEHVKKYKDYRSSFSNEKRPIVMGDLKGNISETWQIEPDMPYRVITNKQGFRMDRNIAFPRKIQRILVLGDSYTFGPYLPNYHTYPYFLEKELENCEVINAGVAGYTIDDEVSLLQEKAKYVEPDIIILQVLDNDLTDLFYFSRNIFDRKRKKHTPSRAELEFFEAIK